MATERTGQSEFAELVADHIFGHIDREELLAVVHGERKSDHIGDDCGTTGPGLDIINAVDLGGFSKIEKLLDEKIPRDPVYMFREPEEAYITLQREVNVEGNPLFPNLFKKFLKTGFVNIQSEEDMLEIYSEDRWNQLSKQEQESSYNWDGDQPSADTEDDAEQYNKDE